MRKINVSIISSLDGVVDNLQLQDEWQQLGVLTNKRPALKVVGEEVVAG